MTDAPIPTEIAPATTETAPAPGSAPPRKATRVFRDASLVVRGVASRCRRVDTHVVPLGECAEPMTPADVERYTVLARARLATFRTVERAKLTLQYTESDGVFRTVVIFDPRHVEIPLV